MSINTDSYMALRRKVESCGADLVAISKTRPPEDIMALYALGQRDFGENRVAEMVEKHAALPKDIRWHFIGHLQRNKVKHIAPFVHLIHAVDSLRLLREIDKQAAGTGRVISVLLQFHIAEEESKYGLTRDGATDLLRKISSAPLPHVHIAGVMGMATFTDDQATVSGEFDKLAEIKNELSKTSFSGDAGFREISMGMSGDYALALAAGSTLVRVGSLIFGPRQG